MTVLEYLIIGLVVVIFSHCYIHYFSRKGRLINKIPGLPILPLMGNIFDFMNTPFEDWFLLIRRINKTYYPIHRLWALGVSVVTILHPDDVEVVLSSTKYIQKCWGYDFIKPWLGTGLLISAGAKWQKRRKMITPAFHFNILSDFVEVFVQESEKLVKSIKEKGGETVEHVDHLSEKYTLNTICETVMGSSFHELDNADEYMEAVKQISEIMAYRTARPWFHNNFLFSWSPKGFEQAKILKTLHKFSRNIINERKKYHEELATKERRASLRTDKSLESDDDIAVHKKRMALLDLLITAYRNSAQIDEVGIQEEVDTFMFEGYDTTGAGLCFSLLLLAENKDIQERARDEVDEVFHASGKKLGMTELQKFSYLERCIKETLRLYPSVHFISRGIKEDIQFKDFLVPKNTSIHMHIYDIHRNPDFWPDPLKFDPDRFLPERIQGRHPFSYIPFSAGPRNCIGQKFAMLELKAVIANILYNFYMEPIELAHQVKIYPDMILKLNPPVRIKFIPRNK